MIDLMRLAPLCFCCSSGALTSGWFWTLLLSLQEVLQHVAGLDEDLRKRLIKAIGERLRQLCKGLVVLAKKPPTEAPPPVPRCDTYPSSDNFLR